MKDAVLTIRANSIDLVRIEVPEDEYSDVVLASLVALSAQLWRTCNGVNEMFVFNRDNDVIIHYVR